MEKFPTQLTNNALNHSRRSSSSNIRQTIIPLTRVPPSKTNQPRLITTWHRMQQRLSYRRVSHQRKSSVLSRRRRLRRRKKAASIVRAIEMVFATKASEVCGRMAAATALSNICVREVSEVSH